MTSTTTLHYHKDQAEFDLPNYLSAEEERNLAGTPVFEKFLKRALGKEVNIIAGHHIIFMADGNPPNEVSSADTLWFDHLLMTRVFGEKALMVMQVCASRPREKRERYIADMLGAIEAEEARKATA